MTTREKLNISREDAREFCWRDHCESFEVVHREIVDQRRWTIVSKIVVKRLSDGKFFSDTYSEGATECQDEKAWEYEEPNFVEVFPTQVMITVYK